MQQGIHSSYLLSVKARRWPFCPSLLDCRVCREQWIKAKYDRKEFVADAPEPTYTSGG